jgi:hypothetical protein
MTADANHSMPASNYLANANLNWLRGTAFPSPAPPDLYLSLHSADPGPNGTNGDVTATLRPSGRVLVIGTNFSAPTNAVGAAGRQSSNTVEIRVTDSAAAPAAVTHVGFWSASTSGNFLAYGLVTPPTNFLAGDIIRFPIGQLVIRIG